MDRGKGQMRIKCRGYEGLLFALETYHEIRMDGSTVVAGYQIQILLDDGARVTLRNVKQYEIEVINNE
jgi:hypothetical protein